MFHQIKNPKINILFDVLVICRNNVTKEKSTEKKPYHASVQHQSRNQRDFDILWHIVHSFEHLEFMVSFPVPKKETW